MLSRHKLRQGMGPQMPLTSSVAGQPHVRVRELGLGSCPHPAVLRCCKVSARSCLLAYKIRLVSQRNALLQAALAERDVNLQEITVTSKDHDLKHRMLIMSRKMAGKRFSSKPLTSLLTLMLALFSVL